MIVKFKNQERQDSFLKLNKEYIVLSMQNNEEGIFYSVLADNDNGPIIVNADNFILTDNNIPFDWVCEVDEKRLCIQPADFSNDFWEKYYEEDENAEKTFYRVYQKLKKFHGWAD
ncbi:hypothetical protein [Candidatus Odyssella thessalonicensis]|uniref:hypothetical protein n=1 Tax=Candidatus Odyssella thessalonicensis TaxID=84647 RepID=UPI000225BFB3|nr:hypothetical protein [Candidatus Odyssella thessalonicensis]